MSALPTWSTVRSESGAARPLTSVAEILTDLLPAHGARTAVRYDDGETYVPLAFPEMLINVRAALRMIGEKPSGQQVVCTFVKNRPEWDMLALASLHGGHVLFPLDTGMDDGEVARLLALSPPDVVLVSTASLGRMRAILAGLGLRPRILIADLYRAFEDAAAPPAGELSDGERRLSSFPRPPGAELPAPSPRLLDPDCVLGHYATSGTTSASKLVRITHRNVLAQLNEGRDVMNLRPHEDVLNVGAYTHIATLLEFLVTKANGFCVTYVTRDVEADGVLEQEIRKLRARGVRVKALMAPPTFWIFLLKEVLEEMKDKPVWHGIYRHLTAIERHAHLVDLGTLDRAKLNATRLFLRNKLGGHFTYGVSSSTRIDAGVIEIFARLGITVIDIYGATEASGIVARNRLNDSRPGSCGRLIPALEHRIHNPRTVPGWSEPVGELLVRGATVSGGYVGMPPGAHLDDDGYYHTGDLACVDEDGWVYLVGREKELIPWPDGSLIDRMHLSNLLVRSVWVKDALVTRLGEDAELSVFVYPDWPRLEKDATARRDLAAGVPREAVLRTRLVEAVRYAESLARITPPLSTDRIYLLPHKLARTPTHKIKFVSELVRLDTGAFV
jgi:long-chain acyl-CoA synthetase